MPSHHEPFAALGPVDWSTVPADDLSSFLADTFASAQTIIDSIPVPAPVQAATAARRSRAQTDPPQPSVALNAAMAARQSGASIKTAQDLMKEWKEVKVNAKDNPLAINVYKLAAKDGRGSWFTRRSIHDGLTFDKWKLGLEREFAESMKVQTGPGGGSIRGIGADKKVEDHFVREAGKAEVFQLSAQFPGPTTPRDFVTLLLSSDAAETKPVPNGAPRPLRTFMILSKPCDHPQCPPRQGYIRGQYESVEIIREVPSDKPGAIKRARSSIDVGAEGSQQRRAVAEDMSRDAVLRAAGKVAGSDESRNRGLSVDSAPARDDAGHHVDAMDDDGDDDDAPTTVEWLMVTRSDPGGNVPRFMIERGTPGGIVSDASKFLNWLTAKAARDFADDPAPAKDEAAAVDGAKTEAVEAEESKATSKPLASTAPTANLVPDSAAPQEPSGAGGHSNGMASSNGLYGMISGAFGYATEAMAGRLPVGLPGFFQSQPNSSDETLSYRNARDEDDSDSLSTISDTSSVRSFTSAMERTESAQNALSADALRDDAVSTQSSESRSLHAPLSHSATHHDKELRKLQERRRKMQDKLNKLQSRMTAKRADGTQSTQRDEAAAARLREKHEREVAKHEEKYQRELRRLEEKRAHDERKAEARRRKAEERELKANAAMELDKVRQQRDLALHEVELLKAQVGELQAQNTRLVADMGKLGKGITGLRRQDSGWSTKSAGVRAPEKVPQAAASS
ncbi:hypothetical protein HYQ45_001129 [Verticillium longisporum]|uniref:DUF3074 domain-containing protein n=1 Tax=Verticillium longisporum TaxID=100787 RepID=A0A8I2ZZT6_VERLO|nr:hypothetical protein HYQ44_001922 [Verticillium longisporum]KAG7142512.1 hypothetical protein HYQ45_001129 [Verticillium longisporum]